MGKASFLQADFDTFLMPGLAERMEAIQTNIQPKFQTLGTELTDFLQAKLGNEMHLHIARHARRTVNPPQDTWLAVADNKRGYKKHPHFQVGLFDDHLFIWLALIYELDYKKDIAEKFLEEYDQLKSLPDHYAISLDHMKKSTLTIGELELKDVERFRDVKSAEFLVGLRLDPTDPRVADDKALLETVQDTFENIIPFYKLAIGTRT